MVEGRSVYIPAGILLCARVEAGQGSGGQGLGSPATKIPVITNQISCRVCRVPLLGRH